MQILVSKVHSSSKDDGDMGSFANRTKFRLPDEDSDEEDTKAQTQQDQENNQKLYDFVSMVISEFACEELQPPKEEVTESHERQYG